MVIRNLDLMKNFAQINMPIALSKPLMKSVNLRKKENTPIPHSIMRVSTNILPALGGRVNRSPLDAEHPQAAAAFPTQDTPPRHRLTRIMKVQPTH
ncbi:hypothethical protein (plasmid) [Ralstonia solanacearum CMR15]|nr:hypothethical protein [Ralstonia solanacearum CMR15]